MIKDFICLSTVTGNRADYVQGGGGNISYKVNSTDMLIKASGCLLKEMTSQEGYVCVNYSNIIDFLKSHPQDEDQVNHYINEQIIFPVTEKKLRPSIETGFHTLIRHKFVSHIHSVYANILNCCVEGPKLIQAYFRDALVIPYKRPGLKLTLSIQEALTEKDASLFFLQNHGLIVAAHTVGDVFQEQDYVTEKIKTLFNLGLFPEPLIETVNHKFYSRTLFVKEKLEKYGIEFIQNHILFPDQVVYFSKEKIKSDDLGIYYDTSFNEAYAIEETLLAYFFILESMKANTLTPLFLPKREAKEILDMESEKHRKQVIQA